MPVFGGDDCERVTHPLVRPAARRSLAPLSSIPLKIIISTAFSRSRSIAREA
jgi:hypothetical protein